MRQHKHLSLLGLWVENCLGKVLALLGLMAALETIVFGVWLYLLPERPMEEVLKGVPFLFLGGWIALFHLLTHCGDERRAVGCTLRRLRVPEGAALAWKSLFGAVCFLLLWAVQTAVCLGMGLWYAAAVGPAYRSAQTVLLAYDSDGAGVKAAVRAIGILREAGLSGKVINMQPYKDPDEFMKALGKEAFQERIGQAENSFFFEIRILEGQFDMNDPEEKTRFHREIARKLCEFSEDVERENYLQAVADKYFISKDNLRKLVMGYAASTGLAKPVERPKSGVRPKKNSPEENARRAQRLLISWLLDEPVLYGKVRKYISAEDFTEELYRKAAGRLFRDMENGAPNPAAIISTFEDGEEQSQAAALFSASLPELGSGQEREKAFHEILLTVKRNSYEYHVAQMGTDVGALAQAIEGKKALEELARTHISLD